MGISNFFFQLRSSQSRVKEYDALSYRSQRRSIFTEHGISYVCRYVHIVIIVQFHFCITTGKHPVEFSDLIGRGIRKSCRSRTWQFNEVQRITKI